MRTPKKTNSTAPANRPTAQQRQGFFWLALLLLLIVVTAVALPTGISRKPSAIPDTTWAKHNEPQSTASDNYCADSDSPQYVPFRKQPFSLEMNSADTLDWQQLYGIGHVFSNRIVRYRQRLGGFHRREQLLEVNGLSDTLYASILPHLRLDTSLIKPIKINTISIDSLKRHPYIDYYQAKAIVRYRESYGSYHSYADLLRVNLVDTATLNRIKPYISFD